MTRHPAVDPRAGARMERDGVVRRVTGRGVAGSVEFQWWRTAAPDKVMSGRQRLSCWQRWARKATVVA